MRFFISFLFWLGIFSVSYLGLAILVDAHNDFGTGIFPVMIQDSRKQKMELFLSMPEHEKVEGIILGSSRSMKLRPAEFTERLNQRFFNFSVDNAKAEDYLAIYRWLRKHGVRPKMLVIGLDIEAMHNDDTPDPRLERSETLHREVTGARPLPGALDAGYQSLMRCKRTVTVAHFSDTLRSMSLYLRRADTRPLSGFEADGYLRYFRLEDMKLRGTFDLQAEISASLEEYSRRLHGMTSLSPRRKQYLEQLIREATADHVLISIWITNLHPVMTERLGTATGYPQLLQQTQEYLQTLRNTAAVRVFDYHDPRLYGGSLTDWYDGAHIGEENARLVVAGLTKGFAEKWSSTRTSSSSPFYR